MIKKSLRYNVPTEVFARYAQVKPATVRVRFCRTGSYFGIRPKKLPNGRLAWPDDSEERLLSGDTPLPAAHACGDVVVQHREVAK